MTSPTPPQPRSARPVIARWSILLIVLAAVGGIAWLTIHHNSGERRRTAHVRLPSEDAQQTMQRLMADPDAQADGKLIFQQRCAICHGPDGQGVVAPNLTDGYYIQVRKLGDFHDIITNGRVGADGQVMPPQGGILPEDDIWLVAAYAASLRGKNLPGKGPEGVTIPPWTSNSATDGAQMHTDEKTEKTQN